MKNKRNKRRNKNKNNKRTKIIAIKPIAAAEEVLEANIEEIAAAAEEAIEASVEALEDIEEVVAAEDEEEPVEASVEVIEDIKEARNIEIIELYKNTSLSAAKIAKEFNISVSTVYNVIKEAGLNTNKINMLLEEIAKLKKGGLNNAN